VIGALALVAGAAVLAFGSLRVAAVLAPRSTAAWLLTAYVAAWAQLVLVLWALSLPGWVSRWPLLAGLAVVSAALARDTRQRSDVGGRLNEAYLTLRDALADPLCVVLGVAVVAGFAYAVALGLATPQNDFDSIVDHLWRAALWMQNDAAGYPDCACAPYVNAYPPHGELGLLATMTLGGADRYAALVQAGAYVALVVGTVGVARGIGLDRRASLLAGLLVATLPVVALQASTAQNDLVVASFLVGAVVFLVAPGRAMPWLAGVATALAIGTKVTAVVALPLLALVALLTPAARLQGVRLLGVVLGAAVGAYWYVVNWRHTGSWDGGFPYEDVDHGIADTTARALRSAIQLIELPGAVGRDRWLYAVVAAAIFAVAGAVALARRSRGAIVSTAAAALVAVAPVTVPDLRRYADAAYRDLWQAVGRDDLAAEVGRDFTRSASNVTWYGPLGPILVIGALVAVVVAVRRGKLPTVALLFVVAPAYWIVVLSALLFYQDAAGRFLMAPVALCIAASGAFAGVRPLAWGIAAVAVTSMALAVLNDSKRPSGIALLERPAPASYWSKPRWEAQGSEVHAPTLIRYVDENVPSDATLALAISASDPGYVLFGRELDRRLELLDRGATDAPAATWAFVSPLGRSQVAPRLCSGWRRVDVAPDGWAVYRRAARC
jgi:hypothetical protein